MQALDLSASLTLLPAVGAARAKLMREGMNLSSLADLLTFFPAKHIDRSRLYSTDELSADMPFVQLRGEQLSYAAPAEGRKRRHIAHFTDGHEVVDLVWFNGIDYFAKLYRLRTVYIVFGRPTRYGDRYNIVHPEIEPADKLNLSTIGLRPYYSVPEKLQKRGLNSRLMSQLTAELLRLIPKPMTETLPAALFERMKLIARD